MKIRLEVLSQLLYRMYCSCRDLRSFYRSSRILFPFSCKISTFLRVIARVFQLTKWSFEVPQIPQTSVGGAWETWESILDRLRLAMCN
jgi:hypothetical protein